ncbi:MAG: GHKL domain-containing protein [Clostridia bacterium]|nr:GHKL domain-containing protein [Clostridia bacterium]
MTRKLQHKFIAAAMLVVTILLVGVLLTINAANIHLARRQSEQILDVLLDDYRRPYHKQEEEEEAVLRPIDHLFGSVSRDTVDAARYFLTEVDQDGIITYIGLDHISSMDRETAAEYVNCVLELGVVSGVLDGFRYDALWQAPGASFIFLSLENQQQQIFTVMLLSTVIGIAAWILMLGLVVLLSHRAIRPVAESIEKQKQFVTDAGHELKTPLAIIRTNVDAMELHLGENKWSRSIRSQTVRLDGLMQDMLTLARADEGRALPEAEEFSPGRLMEEVLAPFIESAAMRGILIEEEIDTQLTIRAPRQSVQRLYSILLDNAVRYTPSGGQIDILLRGKGKGMVMEVSNTCPERPAEDMEKLFDRFYRGDTARTQVSGGYGIGLSAARAIVTACKGSISAHHKDGVLTFKTEL